MGRVILEKVAEMVYYKKLLVMNIGKLKIKEEQNGCYRCTNYSTGSEGYVKVTVDNKQQGGHRYSFFIKNGYYPKVVRHTCDNKWCVNPNHLLPGTHKDNVMDRVKRNRSAKGETNGRSKLSSKQVIEILNDNHTPKMKLARKFSVDPKVIRDIKNGVTWRCVTGL